MASFYYEEGFFFSMRLFIYAKNKLLLPRELLEQIYKQNFANVTHPKRGDKSFITLHPHDFSPNQIIFSISLERDTTLSCEEFLKTLYDTLFAYHQWTK